MGPERSWRARLGRTMADATLRAALRAPWLVLLVGFALAGAAAFVVPRIQIRSDIADLFPEHTPNVRRVRQVKDALGYSAQLVVMIGSPSAEATLGFAAALAEALDGEAGLLRKVEFRREIEFFEKNALLFLPLDELRDLHTRLDRKLRERVERRMRLFDPSDGPSGADDPEFDEPDEDEGEFGGDDEPDEDVGEFAGGAEAATEPPRPKVAVSGPPAEGAGEPAPATAPARGPSRAGSGGGARPTSDGKLPSLDEVRRRYGAEELREYFRSPDGTILSIKAWPLAQPTDVESSRQMLARLQALIDRVDPKRFHPDLQILLEGDYHKKDEDVRTIRRDLARSGGVAGVLVLLLLVAYFRRLRAVPLVLLSLAAGILWTFGLVWLAIGHLNVITAFIFALLLGLGIDFSIHVLSRYREERAAGAGLEEALRRTLRGLGGALGAAAATTAGTFFSLTLFDFRGFSEFGFIAGVGVLLCLLSALVLLPALIVVAERLRPERFEPRLQAQPRPALRIPRRLALVGVVVAAVCTVVAAAGLPRVQFEYDFSQLSGPKPPQPAMKRRYKKEVSRRSFSPIVVLTDSLEETRELDRALRQRDPTTPGSSFRDWMSLYRFVPEDQGERLREVRSIATLLRRKLTLLDGEDRARAEELLPYLDPAAFGYEDLPPWVLDQFRDSQGRLGRFVTIYAGGNKADARDVAEIVNELGTIEAGGKQYHPAASFFIISDVVEVLRAEGPRAVALAFAVVLLILMLDLRSVRRVLLAAVPLLLGTVWMVGAMGWLGLKLNMFNIVVLPTILGIGVDNAVHMVHRHVEEGRGSAGLVLRTTGLAAAVASLTTAAGFAGMLVADNRGLASIGSLALLGIAACLVTSVPVLAAALRLLDGRPSATSSEAP